MRWKFAFGLASDDLFFVTIRRSGPSSGPSVKSRITTFPHEDEFLGNLLRAGLRDDQTTALAMAVITSVARPASPPEWTEADLTQRQMELLHLPGSAFGYPGGDSADPDSNTSPEIDFYRIAAAWPGPTPQFHDLLMQAPTALCMITGPEHRYTFLNHYYAELVGIGSIADALGTSSLDKYAGGERRRLSAVLDRIYQTGEPHIGVESYREFFHQISGAIKGGYFNTVCQPIADPSGQIVGVMVQATDVTDAVAAREVRDHREQQLYRQWAELEAIYASTAIALNVIDAGDFRIIRLNENMARLFNASVAELIGKPVMRYLHEPLRAKTIFARVIAGETVRNEIFERESLGDPSERRSWVCNFSPIFSADRTVEAITVISLEITPEVTVPRTNVLEEPELVHI